jgi:hypothetical protein
MERLILSRRGFLGLAVVALITALERKLTSKDTPDKLGRPFDPTWKIYLDEWETTPTFPAAAQLATRFSEILAILPEAEEFIDPAKAFRIVEEASHLFVVEGFVARAKIPEVKFVDVSSVRYDYNVGSADCQTTLTVNNRVLNDQSPWYQKKDLRWALIHEAAHHHQGKDICNPDSAERHALVEATPELMAAEICAVLAIQGDSRYFRSLVQALQRWSLYTAWAISLEEDRFDDFADLHARLFPGAVAQAGLRREMRRVGHRPNFIHHLHSYGRLPLQLAFTAFKNGAVESADLALPTRPYYGLTDDGKKIDAVPKVKLDDLKDVVQHLEAIAENFRALGL